MRLNKNLIARTVADELVLIPVGDLAQNLHGIFGANETGNFLLQKLQNDISRDELINLLAEEAGLAPQDVACDVDAFLEECKKYGILTMESEDEKEVEIK